MTTDTKLPLPRVEGSESDRIKQFNRQMAQIIDSEPRGDLYLTNIYLAPEHIDSPLEDRAAVLEEVRQLEGPYHVNIGLIFAPNDHWAQPGALLAVVGTLAELEGFLREAYDLPKGA